MGYDTKVAQRAWALLKKAAVQYQGADVGTLAALKTSADTVNYDQIFTRDFFVSGLALLLNGKYETVKNFLRVTSDLQQSDESAQTGHQGHGSCRRKAGPRRLA